MATFMREEHCIAGASMNTFTINLEEKLPVNDVEPLILGKVSMKRRPAVRGDQACENRKSAIGIATGDLYREFFTADMQRSSNSGFPSSHRKCCSGGWALL